MSAQRSGKPGEEVGTPASNNDRPRAAPGHWSARIFLTGTVAVLTSCVTLTTMAPPVENLTGNREGRAAALASGRDIYVGRCAKCHSVEPVLKYTAAQWAEIIPDMAERTKLTPVEEAAVNEYVSAVLKMAAAP